jgi:hypothetical protein
LFPFLSIGLAYGYYWSAPSGLFVYSYLDPDDGLFRSLKNMYGFLSGASPTIAMGFQPMEKANMHDFFYPERVVYLLVGNPNPPIISGTKGT